MNESAQLNGRPATASIGLSKQEREKLIRNGDIAFVKSPSDRQLWQIARYKFKPDGQPKT